MPAPGRLYAGARRHADEPGRERGGLPQPPRHDDGPPAGGASDAIARVVAAPTSRQLGQPVLVENLGGVSGALGAQKVLSARADGYYLFQGSPNELILAPLANASVKLKSEDFQLVQMIGLAPLVIVARKDLPANNADELRKLARARATQPLSFGSVGVGSLYHVLGEHGAHHRRNDARALAARR